MNGNTLAYTFFYKKRVNNKKRHKWPKSQENHKSQFPKLSVFVGQKSIFRDYCIQHVEDDIQA